MDAVPPGHVHAGYGVLLAALGALAWLGGPTGQGTAVLIAGLVPAAVLLVGYRAGARLHPVAWPLVLAGVLTLGAHNTISLVVAAAGTAPGLWYGVTLAGGYALLALAGLLATAPLLRTDLGSAIDSAIIALGCAGLVWTVAAGPSLAGADLATRHRQLAVLIAVCAIVGVVLRALASGLGTRSTGVYLAVAAGGTLTGTVASSAYEQVGSGDRPWWVAVTWIAASLAVAAIAMQPRAIGPARREGVARLSPPRLAFLGAALALFPTLSTIAHLRGTGGDETLVNAAALVVVPLVVTRIGLLARLHASAEDRLTVLATHDELTGLLNRRAVSAHIATLLGGVEAGSSPGFAVLFLDLNDFKVVNDKYGHGTGDRFLVEVARRLRSAVRSTDAVGRFGGDEFVLVLEGEPTSASAAGIASVTAALAMPLDLGEVTASGSASIGAALACPGDRLTAEQLLNAADASMYRVKRAHRGHPGDGPSPAEALAGAQVDPHRADATGEH